MPASSSTISDTARNYRLRPRASVRARSTRGPGGFLRRPATKLSAVLYPLAPDSGVRNWVDGNILCHRRDQDNDVLAEIALKYRAAAVNLHHEVPHGLVKPCLECLVQKVQLRLVPRIACVSRQAWSNAQLCPRVVGRCGDVLIPQVVVARISDEIFG